MLNGYALSDTQLNEIFTDLPSNDTLKIAQTLSVMQERMDNVLDMMLGENDDNVVRFIAPMSFVYVILNNQINELFNKIDERYEQKRDGDWYAILRQCGQLRKTVQTIYSLLQQTNERESHHYAGLNDEHIRQAVEATVMQYGAR